MSTAEVVPDFLIVGTMKSGTTTLADYLSVHPAIWIPEQEVQFFNNERNFARGPGWYSRKLTEGCPPDRIAEMTIGEKTPTYSYQKNCAQRIKDLCPNVKLVWIFRNPVQRTFSNYLHSLKNGSELADFPTAVERELENKNRDRFRNYIERSKYADQVEHFLTLFERDQMHFLVFMHLISQPLEELNKVLRFLGLDEFEAEPPPMASNTTTLPASPLSMWVTKKVFGSESKPYRLMRRINYLYPRPKPKFPPELKEKLAREFDASNARLAELTGLDLSIWKS